MGGVAGTATPKDSSTGGVADTATPQNFRRVESQTLQHLPDIRAVSLPVSCSLLPHRLGVVRVELQTLPHPLDSWLGRHYGLAQSRPPHGVQIDSSPGLAHPM